MLKIYSPKKIHYSIFWENNGTHNFLSIDIDNFMFSRTNVRVGNLFYVKYFERRPKNSFVILDEITYFDKGDTEACKFSV